MIALTGNKHHEDTARMVNVRYRNHPPAFNRQVRSGLEPRKLNRPWFQSRHKRAANATILIPVRGQSEQGNAAADQDNNLILCFEGHGSIPKKPVLNKQGRNLKSSTTRRHMNNPAKSNLTAVFNISSITHQKRHFQAIWREHSSTEHAIFPSVNDIDFPGKSNTTGLLKRNPRNSNQTIPRKYINNA